jgi:hypothetical protein
MHGEWLFEMFRSQLLMALGTALVSLALMPADVSRADDKLALPGKTLFILVAPFQGADALVAQLVATADNDGVFMLDADAGAVIFGDGLRGRVPETGSGSPDQRAVQSLRHRDRAITVADFEKLAAVSPGSKVGRVEVPTDEDNDESDVGETQPD